MLNSTSQFSKFCAHWWRQAVDSYIQGHIARYGRGPIYQIGLRWTAKIHRVSSPVSWIGVRIAVGSWPAFSRPSYAWVFWQLNVANVQSCLSPVSTAILQAAGVGFGAWWINADNTVKVAESFYMSMAVPGLYLVTAIIMAISAQQTSDRVITSDTSPGVELVQMRPRAPALSSSSVAYASAPPLSSSPTGNKLSQDPLDHMHAATAGSPPPYKLTADLPPRYKVNV